MSRIYITLEGKRYIVEFEDALYWGTTNPAHTRIWSEWEVPNVADRWRISPRMVTKTRRLDAGGKVFKKVMEEVAKVTAPRSRR